jgi:hypothetical protein
VTYAPQKLLELAAYWKRENGVFLGIVGDTDHQAKGVSYHLGKDQLQPGAYSAERPRDRLGLTNAAAAIDLGKLNGSYGQLRAFSDWLARRCVKGDTGTGDVVEVIYSPDGKRVLGFKDGIDYLIPNYGDATHLFHTHISFYRDSEYRDKVALFAPFFTPEVAVQDFTWTTTAATSAPGTVTVSETGVSAILPDGRLFPLTKGTTKHSYGLGKFKGGGWDGQEAYVIGDGLAFLLKRNVTWSPDLVP